MKTVLMSILLVIACHAGDAIKIDSTMLFVEKMPLLSSGEILKLDFNSDLHVDRWPPGTRLIVDTDGVLRVDSLDLTLLKSIPFCKLPTQKPKEKK